MLLEWNKSLWPFWQILCWLFLIHFVFKLYLFFYDFCSYMIIKDASLRLFVYINVLKLYSKDLGTSLLWVSSMLNDNLCMNVNNFPQSSHFLVHYCICIHTKIHCASAMLVVWEWCVSHLLCPLSRQPVQCSESMISAGQNVKKTEIEWMNERLCVCVVDEKRKSYYLKH